MVDIGRRSGYNKVVLRRLVAILFINREPQLNPQLRLKSARFIPAINFANVSQDGYKTGALSV